LSNLEHWQNHWDRTASLAALIGCSGILVHSFVEFNLQIPANAAFFYAVCALAASDLKADIVGRQRRIAWKTDMMQ